MPKPSPQRGSEILTAAVSNIGASTRRTVLEDRSRTGHLRTAGGLDVTLGVVADGIGGENAGERAAEVTVTSVFDFCARSTEKDIPRLLKGALEEANRRVFADARGSRRKSNMGSTAAVAAISGGRLYVANVGDSRVYLVRERRALCLTVDHTWENEVVRSGRLSAAEAARHPRKDEIVRSIGYEQSLEVDLGLWLQGGKEPAERARAAQALTMQPGDRVVVCSDGLIKTRHDDPMAHYVEESQIAALVEGRPAKQAADALVGQALSAKVDDNVSVVVLEMPGATYARAPIGAKIGAGVALALAVGGAALVVPRLVTSLLGPPPTPTIPPLPSGVAYVSEVGGSAEVELYGSGPRALQAEDIVAAGEGVLLRTLGLGSYLRLGLADQSIVYLGPDSEVELSAIADGSSLLETSLILRRGIVLIASGGRPQQTVAVRTPSGGLARLLGSVMGVIFDDLLPRQDVDCFQGRCELYDEAGGRLPVTVQQGQHAWLSGAGMVSPPDATRNELYSFAGYCGGLIPTPTPPVGGGPAAATRTPLGPLFVEPTRPPTPTATRAAPRPPPPTATPVPTETEVPTNTIRPTRTPRPPTDAPEPPPDTEEPPPWTDPPGS